MRNKKSYAIAAVIMLAAAFGMTGIYYSQQNKKQEARLAREQEKMEQTAKARAEEKARQTAQNSQEMNPAEAVSGIIPPESGDFLDAPEAVTEPKAVVEPAPQVAEQHFDATNLEWPLQGNVIMNYSMDQTIYFATLDQYKYNPAIVIQAEVNTPVEAVASGKVTNIETSAETGVTMTVDLGDGYSAVYGQLKEIPQKTGDTIKAGEVIGYVSEPTKYYALEGSNLYFKLSKDGSPVNPMEYLE